MKLFVDKIPINIIKSDKKLERNEFDVIIHAPDEAIVPEKLQEDVLITEADENHIEFLLQIIKDNRLKKLDSITVTVIDEDSAKHFIKSKFKVIKAAGGLVRKGNKVLLIYRLKTWDLPKGKLDKGETTVVAAIREVEEECNIKVSLGEKICSTWHTYTQNGKRILKKTSWYSMDCLDDSTMKPQLEEGIEDIRWMDTREVRYSLYDSYGTIRHVFQKYNKKKKRRSQSL